MSKPRRLAEVLKAIDAEVKSARLEGREFEDVTTPSAMSSSKYKEEGGAAAVAKPILSSSSNSDAPRDSKDIWLELKNTFPEIVKDGKINANDLIVLIPGIVSNPDQFQMESDLYNDALAQAEIKFSLILEAFFKDGLLEKTPNSQEQLKETLTKIIIKNCNLFRPIMKHYPSHLEDFMINEKSLRQFVGISVEKSNPEDIRLIIKYLKENRRIFSDDPKFVSKFFGENPEKDMPSILKFCLDNFLYSYNDSDQKIALEIIDLVAKECSKYINDKYVSANDKDITPLCDAAFNYSYYANSVGMELAAKNSLRLMAILLLNGADRKILPSNLEATNAVALVALNAVESMIKKHGDLTLDLINTDENLLNDVIEQIKRDVSSNVKLGVRGFLDCGIVGIGDVSDDSVCEYLKARYTRNISRWMTLEVVDEEIPADIKDIEDRCIELAKEVLNVSGGAEPYFKFKHDGKEGLQNPGLISVEINLLKIRRLLNSAKKDEAKTIAKKVKKVLKNLTKGLTLPPSEIKTKPGKAGVASAKKKNKAVMEAFVRGLPSNLALLPFAELGFLEDDPVLRWVARVSVLKTIAADCEYLDEEFSKLARRTLKVAMGVRPIQAAKIFDLAMGSKRGNAAYDLIYTESLKDEAKKMKDEDVYNAIASAACDNPEYFKLTLSSLLNRNGRNINKLTILRNLYSKIARDGGPEPITYLVIKAIIDNDKSCREAKDEKSRKRYASKSVHLREVLSEIIANYTSIDELKYCLVRFIEDDQIPEFFCALPKNSRSINCQKLFLDALVYILSEPLLAVKGKMPDAKQSVTYGAMDGKVLVERTAKDLRQLVIRAIKSFEDYCNRIGADGLRSVNLGREDPLLVISDLEIVSLLIAHGMDCNSLSQENYADRVAGHFPLQSPASFYIRNDVLLRVYGNRRIPSKEDPTEDIEKTKALKSELLLSLIGINSKDEFIDFWKERSFKESGFLALLEDPEMLALTAANLTYLTIEDCVDKNGVTLKKLLEKSLCAIVNLSRRKAYYQVQRCKNMRALLRAPIETKEAAMQKLAAVIIHGDEKLFEETLRECGGYGINIPVMIIHATGQGMINPSIILHVMRNIDDFQDVFKDKENIIEKFCESLIPIIKKEKDLSVILSCIAKGDKQGAMKALEIRNKNFDDFSKFIEAMTDMKVVTGPNFEEITRVADDYKRNLPQEAFALLEGINHISHQYTTTIDLLFDKLQKDCHVDQYEDQKKELLKRIYDRSPTLPAEYIISAIKKSGLPLEKILAEKLLPGAIFTQDYEEFSFEQISQIDRSMKIAQHFFQNAENLTDPNVIRLLVNLCALCKHTHNSMEEIVTNIVGGTSLNQDRISLTQAAEAFLAEYQKTRIIPKEETEELDREIHNDAGAAPSDDGVIGSADSLMNVLRGAMHHNPAEVEGGEDRVIKIEATPEVMTMLEEVRKMQEQEEERKKKALAELALRRKAEKESAEALAKAEKEEAEALAALQMVNEKSVEALEADFAGQEDEIRELQDRVSKVAQRSMDLQKEQEKIAKEKARLEKLPDSVLMKIAGQHHMAHEILTKRIASIRQMAANSTEEKQDVGMQLAQTQAELEEKKRELDLGIGILKAQLSQERKNVREETKQKLEEAKNKAARKLESEKRNTKRAKDQNQGIKGDNAKLKEEIAALNAQLAELRKKLTQTSKGKSKKEDTDKIKQLEELLDEALKDASEKASEINSAKSSAEAEKQALLKEMEALAEKVKKAEADNKSFQQAISKKDLELKRTQHSLATVQANIATVQASLAAAQEAAAAEQKKATAAALSEIEKMKASARAEVISNIQEVGRRAEATMAAQKKAHDETIATLTAELELTKAENAQLKEGRNLSVHDENAKLMEEKKKAEADLARAVKSEQSLREEKGIPILHAQIDDLTTKNATLNAQVSHLQAIIENLNHQLNQSLYHLTIHEAKINFYAGMISSGQGGELPQPSDITVSKDSAGNVLVAVQKTFIMSPDASYGSNPMAGHGYPVAMMGQYPQLPMAGYGHPGPMMGHPAAAHVRASSAPQPQHSRRVEGQPRATASAPPLSHSRRESAPAPHFARGNRQQNSPHGRPNQQKPPAAPPPSQVEPKSAKAADEGSKEKGGKGAE